ISAESGLKTFRDGDGLWEGYNVYDVATPGAFARNPQLVLDFYNARRSDVAEAIPNAAHEGLAQLESKYDVQIITQNIDDLHERGGSTQVLHLHGEIFKMRSVNDESNIVEIKENIMLGDLAGDGGQYRPHIVWFEEPVPLIVEAAKLASKADIFVVIGTSLVVYPAAGLLDYVPVTTPKYIIDKNIPFVRGIQNLVTIEKPATEGVKELLKTLL
ncbi:MAG: NAD-dependent deacylase, partial [Proteobacteria bacterium]